MTFKLWQMMWTFNFRWGIGFDVEATDGRPVWTVIDNSDIITPMAFDGLVILFPFTCLTIGNVHTLEDI